MNEKKLVQNFKSYINVSPKNNAEKNGALQEVTPKLLNGEVVVGAAHNVVMLTPLSQRHHDRGRFGSLFVTNYKLSFVPLEANTNDEKGDSSIEETSFMIPMVAGKESELSFVPLDFAQEESGQRNFLLGPHDIPLTAVGAIYLTDGATSPVRARRILVPTGEMPKKVKGLQVVCKNMLVLNFSFGQAAVGKGRTVAMALLHHAFPKRHDLLFAFECRDLYYPTLPHDLNMFVTPGDWKRELERCECPHWRITCINGTSDAFMLTAGETLIVPNSVLDYSLMESARHFRSGRVPIWVWGRPEGAALLRSGELLPTDSSATTESVYLEQTKTLLGVYYNPSMYNNYYNSFEKVLEDYIPIYNHVIIMGDFNTCLLKKDVRSSSFLSLTQASNMTILPLGATHHFPNCIPTLLDLILVSSPNHVAKHGQCGADGFSYHDLIYLSYKIRPPKAKPRTLLQRNFGGMVLENLRSDAQNAAWDAVYNANTVDEKVSAFNSVMIRLYDVHAPVRAVRMKHLPAPWLTDEIKVMINRKISAKSKFKHQPSDSNRDKYIALRNHCNKVCRDAQRRHIHESVQNGDPAKVWNFLRSLGVGKSRSQSIPKDLDLNLLNQHFTSSVAMDSATKNRTLNTLSSKPTPDFSEFNFSQFADSDVERSILAITSNAVGSDSISRKMVLPILDIILPVISHILNFSISSNTFPSTWKDAQVTPLPKKSNPSFSDYRPISILPFLSKVLERLVHHQLNRFLVRNDLMNPYQSGFRPGHSTVTALVQITDDVRQGMENGELTVLSLLDFSNAFNTVDFDILLGVLRSLNVSPTVIDWFHTYLHGRRQRIRIEESNSVWCSTTAGVPQGGVLSPLLFAIFINSISDNISSSYHLYADDLQIYNQASISDLPLAIRKTNIDLDHILLWSKDHGLKVNPTKTQVIVLGSPRFTSLVDLNTLPPIVFNGVHIHWSKCVKNLGVYMDSAMTWKNQLDEVRRSHPKLTPPHVIYLCGNSVPGAPSPNSLPPLPALHASYKKLVELCTPTTLQGFWTQDSQYYSYLDSSRWLRHVGCCLAAAADAAAHLAANDTVVVLEGDGVDYCAVVSSLTQLLVDPHFRTITGFQSLVQKEWLALGHPFCDRLGLPRPGNGKDTKEPLVQSQLAPVFLLFLDCVWQLQRQFPADFEFTETYLTTLWDCTNNHLFDTFLFNCPRDRELLRDKQNFVRRPVWDWGEQFSDADIALFYNPLFPPPAARAPQRATSTPTQRLFWDWGEQFSDADIALFYNPLFPPPAARAPQRAASTPTQRLFWDWGEQFSDADIALFYNPLFPPAAAARAPQRAAGTPTQRLSRTPTKSPHPPEAKTFQRLQPCTSVAAMELWSQCYERWLTPLDAPAVGIVQYHVFNYAVRKEIRRLEEKLKSLSIMSNRHSNGDTEPTEANPPSVVSRFYPFSHDHSNLNSRALDSMQVSLIDASQLLDSQSLLNAPD
ncbi:unnamed protein product [Plutella xylostella]|uniref:(diamondback moth) hypothetical protein n=1 Tax=Plutella xylostella TaxID=51655 RepID=A0A8S4FPU0_PLUXY|nr:unnamed protein product [Plutella xylostella]